MIHRNFTTSAYVCFAVEIKTDQHAWYRGNDEIAHIVANNDVKAMLKVVREMVEDQKDNKNRSIQFEIACWSRMHIRSKMNGGLRAYVVFKRTLPRNFYVLKVDEDFRAYRS